MNGAAQQSLSAQRRECVRTGNLVASSSRSPLSHAEIELKNQLENTVSQAFFIAGQALKELRDKRLYRETHNSFISYVKDRFDFTRRAADYLISASEVMENLKREQIVFDTNVLPTKESQCREVAKLPPEQQPQGWLTSVEKAGGKVPSARIIRQVVQELREEEAKVINPKNKKDGPVVVPGIGVEYVAVLNEKTHSLLKEYMQRKGKATFNGAIQQLLDEENQRNP